jgi:hypothetical protein
MLAKHRLLLVNLVLLLVLGAAAWGRSTEGHALAQADFLKPLDLPVRVW